MITLTLTLTITLMITLTITLVCLLARVCCALLTDSGPCVLCPAAYRE